MMRPAATACKSSSAVSAPPWPPPLKPSPRYAAGMLVPGVLQFHLPQGLDAFAQRCLFPSGAPRTSLSTEPRLHERLIPPPLPSSSSSSSCSWRRLEARLRNGLRPPPPPPPSAEERLPMGGEGERKPNFERRGTKSCSSAEEKERSSKTRKKQTCSLLCHVLRPAPHN